MEAAGIVFKQIMTMFLYMLAGFLLVKTKKLSEQGSRDLATMLIWLVIPATLINSFCTVCSPEKLLALAQSAFLAALALGLAMLIARLIFRRSPIDEFAATYSNAGFIGIPLVTASLGSEAVFYTVGIITLMNVLQWTIGVQRLTGRRGAFSVKSLLLSPVVIAGLIGLALFVTGLGANLPTVLSGALKGLAALNAPLAMMVLGAYFARVDVGAMFRSGRLYLLSAVRLLLIPLLTVVAFRLTGLPQTMRMAVLISASAPVGVNVAVYAQLHDLDYAYASETVVLSTLLSVVFQPLVLMLAAGL
ncbi:MAG: AEC family transporter [Oscillospiraceae bacterium]|nr:AEC family transporter [Oscillospiraceae bacterium]